MRPTRDQWALQLAHVTASRATCLRRQVGCILLNERGHIIGEGYNGVASGEPHCNEAVGTVSIRTGIEVRGLTYPHACPGATAPSGTALDACQAIHAEQNALLTCRDVWSIHTAAITASPCMTCVKLLMNTSCMRIVFSEEYTHPEAKALWLRSRPGREWVQERVLVKWGVIA